MTLELAERELRSALAEQSIVAWYQPIVRLQDRIPCGVEALARLHHPTNGMMAPAAFVPSLERAGLGRALTEAMLHRAGIDWGGDSLSRLDLTLSLNMPLDVLLQPDTPARVDALRRASGMAADRLVLELTESQPLTRIADLHRAVGRIRALGCGIAIDDVGPEIRDHAPLLAMPFTALKLDKTVVQQTSRDAAARHFVREVIAKAQGAGMSITAEGIEDEACWRTMAELGAEHAQGYFIGRPMEALKILDWQAEWAVRG